MKPIDIFITTFLRQDFAKECVEYIAARTTTPFRLTILDNGGNEWAKNSSLVHRYVPLHKLVGNTGIHFAWNVAVSLAESEFFITSDPDLLVPNLENKYVVEKTKGWEFLLYGVKGPDWLRYMISFMEADPKWGAISMHPHVFIGAAGIDPKEPMDVVERNMCGAVMRIMRTDAVREVRGWDLIISAGRNHEERTICSRLQAGGYKTGICSRIRAYHNFGKNWGYPEEFTPEMQKHNPELKEYVLSFDHKEPYDQDTWMPK